MHMITLFQDIFRKEKLEKLADGLRSYTVQSTSSQTGLIEAMTDAQSIDSVKRRLLKQGKPTSLEYYYRQRFGASVSWADGGASSSSGVGAGGDSENGGTPGGRTASQDGNASFEEAQWMCMYSVAAYSLVQYILALKDRHNGNILIDSRGRMVHIDFSYMLGWAPGGITFEKTAFKLTRDIVDVWGGRGSPIYDEFTNVMVQGMQALRDHHRSIMRNVELMVASGAKFPCLIQADPLDPLNAASLVGGGKRPSKRIISQLRLRFRLYKSKHKLRRYTLMLIDYAYDNFWTITYAKFQLLTNGVVP
jgi:phosphatidylinositol kinase/protein kinase (PI-3  family)